MRSFWLTAAAAFTGATASGSNPWNQVFFAKYDSPLDASDEEALDLEQDEQDLAMEPGGLVTLEEVEPVENLIIFGAGPAGLTAAIYASRANLRPLIVARDAGQLASTGDVENFPSCQASTGEAIVASFWSQAKSFGARSLTTEVTSVDFEADPYVMHLDGGGSIRFKSMIIATGAQSKRLWKTPGEDQYYGKGVASCATCEGWFFRNKHIAVIGGGDTAMEEALFLSRICRSVTVLHRRDAFRASRVMADRVIAHPKIKVLWNTSIVEFIGNGEKLTHVAVTNEFTESDELLEVQGAFVAIGHSPSTEAFKGSRLDLDDEGYIRTARGTATPVEGVFAAGDVADRVYRQAITSAGLGAMAAMDAERHLCHMGC